MSKHARASRTSTMVRRAAIGAIGAPVAMMAAAGPAAAAGLDMAGTLSDDLPVSGVAVRGGVELDLADLGGEDGFTTPALPSLDNLSSLVDGLASLPGPDGVPSLPNLDALPSIVGSDILGSLPIVADLPSLPTTEDLPSLPGPDDLPSLPSAESPSQPGPAGAPSLPDVSGVVSEVTGAASAVASGAVSGLAAANEELRTGVNLDLDAATDALPAAGAVFSAADLVRSII